MPTIKLADGKLTMFNRLESPHWQVAFRLTDGTRIQKSLGTMDEAVARQRAMAIYDEARLRERMGLSARAVSFNQAADAWLRELKAEADAGLRKQRNVIDYTPIMDRYLKPFFGEKSIDEIREPDIAQYRSWRRDYWIKGPGSKITHIEYERGGLLVQKPLPRGIKAPRTGTVNTENTVLRGIFNHAKNQRWVTVQQIPEIKNEVQRKSEAKRHAHRPFTQAECQQLERFLDGWVGANHIKERERWRREAIQDFILLLMAGGFRENELSKKDERTGEWSGVCWRDVEFFTSAKGVPLVQLRVTGKTGPRETVPMQNAEFILRRRQQRCPNAGPDDFVMSLPDGSRIAGFDSGVRRVLTAAGLLQDPVTGRKRGIYSFRHTYATLLVTSGRVSPAELGANMGTSLPMIDRHYYHFDPKKAADRLADTTDDR
jgi:integrase